MTTSVILVVMLVVVGVVVLVMVVVGVDCGRVGCDCGWRCGI